MGFHGSWASEKVTAGKTAAQTNDVCKANTIDDLWHLI